MGVIIVVIVAGAFIGLWKFLRIGEILAVRKADREFQETEELAEENRTKKSEYFPSSNPDSPMTATEVQTRMQQASQEALFRLAAQKHVDPPVDLPYQLRNEFTTSAKPWQLQVPTFGDSASFRPPTHLGVTGLRDLGKHICHDDAGQMYLAHVILADTIFQDEEGNPIRIRVEIDEYRLMFGKLGEMVYQELKEKTLPYRKSVHEAERLKGELDHCLLKLEALEEATGLREEKDGDEKTAAQKSVDLDQATDSGDLVEAQGPETPKAEHDGSDGTPEGYEEGRIGDDHLDAESTFGASLLFSQRAPEVEYHEDRAPCSEEDNERQESEAKTEQVVQEDNGEGE